MFRFAIIDPNVDSTVVYKSEVYDETIHGHVYVWDYKINNYVHKHTWEEVIYEIHKHTLDNV